MNLEQRECKCGCGATFKVLPASRMVFSSKKCEVAYKNRAETKKEGEPLGDYHPDESQTRTLRALANIFGVKK